ncbi:MAG: histidine phosphatase family protein [Clostridia bacterium]|nr:histidine phosphatase family protein [Clostridia bacterium]
MKTVFYIIRHGESIGNFNRLFLGHTNMDLTERGYKQADMTADALKNVHFDVIYSSDLLRAYNTAVPNAKLRDMVIIKDKRLREIYAGRWEGMSAEDIIKKDGELFTVEWRRNFGTFRIPEGESVIEAGERFASAVKSIAEENRDKTILITSHAAVIRSFYCKISGFLPNEYSAKLPFPSNASYSVVEYENGAFHPISYSNDAHMGSLVTRIKEK